MDISFQTLEISGHKNELVPNTFLKQAQAASHATIVLPGLGYTAQMPLLFYISEMLVAQRVDVLQVNYDYREAFRGLDSAARERRLFDDSEAAYRALCKQRPYQHITIVGKSLGTQAMTHLLATQTLPARAEALWLTPVLTNSAVRRHIATFSGPSLVVLGDADSFYDPALLAEIGETSTRKFVIVEGADHGMNVGDDVFQSLQALEQVLHAVKDFLNH